MPLHSLNSATMGTKLWVWTSAMHVSFVSVHVKINGLLTFFFKWYKLKVFLLFVISLSEIKCMR